jgi:hypothetical protein
MSGDEMKLEAFAQEARELDERILRELERSPEISSTIPEDFAARVAANVPVRPSLAIRTSHYGRLLMAASLVVLFVALVVLAARGVAGSPVGQAIEWTLCVQFLAIAVWMGTQRRRSN